MRNRASSASASAPGAIEINKAQTPGRTTAGWVLASTMLGVDPNAAAIVADAPSAAATLEKSPTSIESPAGGSASDVLRSRNWPFSQHFGARGGQPGRKNPLLC